MWGCVFIECVCWVFVCVCVSKQQCSVYSHTCRHSKSSLFRHTLFQWTICSNPNRPSYSQFIIHVNRDMRHRVCVCVCGTWVCMHVCSLVFLPSSTVHFVFLSAFISSHSWHTDSLSLWLRTLEDIVFCTAHYPQTCRSRTHTHTHIPHFLCRL